MLRRQPGIGSPVFSRWEERKWTDACFVAGGMNSHVSHVRVRAILERASITREDVISDDRGLREYVAILSCSPTWRRNVIPLLAAQSRSPARFPKDERFLGIYAWERVEYRSQDLPFFSSSNATDLSWIWFDEIYAEELFGYEQTSLPVR